MWSRVKRLFWVGLVGTAAVVAARAELKVGDVVPALSRFGLEGEMPETSGKVVLLDFWASWCAPCKSALPAYARLQQELAGEGFTVLAVSVDQDKARYDAFVTKLRPDFPTLRDASHRAAKTLEIPAMPTSYLVDRRGTVRAVHRGFHGEDSVRELRIEIRKLVEEKL